MTIAEQITRIKNAKAAIKQSIENKGVTVSDTAKLDEYPALINSISGGESNDYWPNFFEIRSKNADYLFANIEILPTETRYKDLIENCDVSKSRSFASTFERFCDSDGCITELDLTKWNTSKGLSFATMFDGCRLDYLNISGWDFSSILSTSCQLFMGAAIKEINMANCNTSNVITLYRLAYQASDLVSIDITGCDTSAVTAVTSAFAYCPKLTTIIGEIDASNVSGLYPGSSTGLFYKCTSLETVYLKNIYKNVTTMKNEAKWSINLAETKIKDECLVYIINELPDLINDKGLTATDKIVLTLPPTNTLTEEQKQVARDKGWQVVN